MALISKPYTFSTGATIVASEHNSDFDTVYNLVNGNIDNANIKANAAIDSSKIGAITAASKISGASMYNLNLIPNTAGTIPNANLPTGILPSGIIVMWSGTIASIPANWYLCDGTNGTPNLTDRFVIGAGNTYAVAATSDGSIPAHTHTIAMRLSANNMGHTINDGAAGTDGAQQTGSMNTGSYGTGTKVIATYYALAYIMKS